MGISPDLPRRNIVRILTNELKSAKLLRRKGFSPKQSEAIMSMITGMEIHNLYSSDECDSMLSEAVEKIFAKQDEKLREQRREFDVMFKLIQGESRELGKGLHEENRELKNEMKVDFNTRFSQFHDEIKSSRRWLIGTIVTVGMGLAAYLSALIKISH